MTDILINTMIGLAIIAIILFWITETNWFWRMVGYTRKKDIRSTERELNRNWYGERK